jgi:hypothetical protein
MCGSHRHSLAEPPLDASILNPRAGSQARRRYPLMNTVIGAGEGNRTPVRSLGSSCSAIELHPRSPDHRRSAAGRKSVAGRAALPEADLGLPPRHCSFRIPAFQGVRKSTIDWDQRSACFETAPSRPPQHEELFLVPSESYLMLRSVRGRVSKHARPRRSVFSAALTDFRTPAFAGITTRCANFMFRWVGPVAGRPGRFPYWPADRLRGSPGRRRCRSRCDACRPG